MELTPGTVVLGKYRIDELIGTGGMGNVVRASHLYLHQSFAIKILLPHIAESPQTKERFLREAQATVRLKSEHSARVTDVGVMPDGVPFMVMEYLEGNDLSQILRHHGPQLPPIVVDLMLQACEGMSEAHALGIVHRDIKPSNFFITRRPDGSMLLKILDFGISKTPVGFDELTGTQTVLGTPSYMAPEQMKSGRAADPRSDVWSIGVVMYQLLTGATPFSGESYAELVLKVSVEPPYPIQMPLPPGLAEVVMRCLEKSPARRFQTVGELAQALSPFATDPMSAIQSATRSVRTLEQRGQHPTGVGSTVAASGGLAMPIPLSPAQLTPRWPPTHGSSLSHGSGQVTMRTRSSRGVLAAGIIGLCVLAGVGGYAVNQLSHDDGRSFPQVQSRPLPAPEETPAEHATSHSVGAKPIADGPAAVVVPAGSGSAAESPATAWKPSEPEPTISGNADPVPPADSGGTASASRRTPREPSTDVRAARAAGEKEREREAEKEREAAKELERAVAKERAADKKKLKASKPSDDDDDKAGKKADKIKKPADDGGKPKKSSDDDLFKKRK